MGVLGSLLGLVLLLFLLVLIARAVLDWAGVLTSSTSEGVLLKAREVTYRLTEPVIAPVRRVLKPVRLGGVQIDLAFTVVFFATLILRSIVTSF